MQSIKNGNCLQMENNVGTFSYGIMIRSTAIHCFWDFLQNGNVLWTYFRHQNCKNMGKYKWCNLQHVMHEPNTIDDACINISNGNANETNDIARKRNGNTHKKNAKPYAQIDGKSRCECICFFYFTWKWSDAINVDIETKWNSKCECGREKSEIQTCHWSAQKIADPKRGRKQKTNKIYRLQ